MQYLKEEAAQSLSYNDSIPSIFSLKHIQQFKFTIISFSMKKKSHITIPSVSFSPKHS